MCILCTPRPIYRSTYRPTLDRCIDRHIGRVSTDMAVECRPICRPRCVAWYIGRHIGGASVDMSTDTRPICLPTYWSTCWSSVGRYVNQDVSLDISADISVEHRSICQLTLDRYVGRYVDWEWFSDCRPTCRSIGYRHSADTSRLLAYSAAQISLIYSPLLRGFQSSQSHKTESKINWTQSSPSWLDFCLIGSLIKHNQARIFQWVR